MAREVILQKIGKTVFCARVNGGQLILFCETEGGKFTGFSMHVNNTLRRGLLQLARLVLEGEDSDD